MSAPTPVYVSETGLGIPGPEEVLAQLSKLLTSRPLRESQLQSFLEFIVKETLSGRQDGLKEYLLGCQVFGRRRDYDPRHDGIVRVQATTLRKRLERYYAEDGATDLVLIDLPRGGYVPTFRYRPASVEGSQRVYRSGTSHTAVHGRSPDVGKILPVGRRRCDCGERGVGLFSPVT